MNKPSTHILLSPYYLFGSLLAWVFASLVIRMILHSSANNKAEAVLGGILIPVCLGALYLTQRAIAVLRIRNNGARISGGLGLTKLVLNPGPNKRITMTRRCETMLEPRIVENTKVKKFIGMLLRGFIFAYGPNRSASFYFGGGGLVQFLILILHDPTQNPNKKSAILPDTNAWNRSAYNRFLGWCKDNEIEVNLDHDVSF